MVKTCVALCVAFVHVVDAVRTSQQQKESHLAEEEVGSDRWFPGTPMVGIQRILPTPPINSVHHIHPIRPISTSHSIGSIKMSGRQRSDNHVLSLGSSPSESRPAENYLLGLERKVSSRPSKEYLEYYLVDPERPWQNDTNTFMNAEAGAALPEMGQFKVDPYASASYPPAVAAEYRLDKSRPAENYLMALERSWQKDTNTFVSADADTALPGMGQSKVEPYASAPHAPAVAAEYTSNKSRPAENYLLALERPWQKDTHTFFNGEADTALPETGQFKVEPSASASYTPAVAAEYRPNKSGPAGNYLLALERPWQKDTNTFVNADADTALPGMGQFKVEPYASAPYAPAVAAEYTLNKSRPAENYLLALERPWQKDTSTFVNGDADTALSDVEEFKVAPDASASHAPAPAEDEYLRDEYIRKLEKTLTEFQAALYTSATEANGAQSLASELKGQLEKSKAAEEASQLKVVAEEAKLRKLEAEIVELEKVTKQSSARAAASDNDLRRLEADVATSKVLKEAAVREVRATEAKVVQLEAKLAELKATQEASTLKAAASEDQLRKFEAEKALEEASVLEQLRDMVAKWEELKVREQAYAVRVATSETELHRLEAEAARSKAAEEVTALKAANAEAQLRRLEEEVATSKALEGAAVSQARAVEAQVRELELKLAELKATEQASTLKVMTSEAHLHRLEAEVARSKVAEFAAALKAASVETQLLQSEADAWRKQAPTLRDAASEAQFQKLELEVAKSKALEEAAMLKAAAAEGQLRKLKAEIAGINAKAKVEEEEFKAAMEGKGVRRSERESARVRKIERKSAPEKTENDQHADDETSAANPLRAALEEPLRGAVGELKRQLEQKETELRDYLAKTFAPAFFPQNTRRLEAKMRGAKKLLSDVEELQKLLKTVETDLRQYKRKLEEKTPRGNP